MFYTKFYFKFIEKRFAKRERYFINFEKLSKSPKFIKIMNFD